MNTIEDLNDFTDNTIKILRNRVEKFINDEDCIQSMNDAKQAVEIMDKLYSMRQKSEEPDYIEAEEQEPVLHVTIPTDDEILGSKN